MFDIGSCVVVYRTGLWIDEFAVQPLVGSLGVVMCDVFSNGQPKVGFTKGNDVIETLTPDGSDESFGESIQVGTVGRQFDHVCACVTQNESEGLSKQRIAIMDEEAMFAENAIEGLCEIVPLWVGPSPARSAVS